MDYRQEWKYLCSEGQLAILAARLAPLLRPDEHQPDANGYLVRSLYFDTPGNRLLEENLSGVDDRMKFRLRLYNGSDEAVYLEIKQKLHGMVKKDVCPLTHGQCEELMAGRCPPYSRDYPPSLRRLYVEMSASPLRPVVIVEYRRTALVGRIGNVRITFDRFIGSSTEVGRFLTPRLPITPLLPPGQQILEVKFDELIPDYILQALELGSLRQNTFSKYAMCRAAL